MGMYGYQPMYPQSYKREVIRVNGRGGVDAYRMPTNSSELLLDETAPLVWLVQTDGAGYKTAAAFDITPHMASGVGITWERITPWGWWATMNMMYSDYCGVAERHGVHTAEFYADLAKAFLLDKDGGEPQKKLAAYYCGIVKG